MITPIYIFSLPRSGSTLLQRLLSNSDQIVSTPETWLLLPLLFTTKAKGIKSIYWQDHASLAISEFINGMPNGMNDYKVLLRNFILNLYEYRSGFGARYFLDKTPRYHIIVQEIIDLFPDGKFIFLWRNPLDIVASMVNSWFKGKWKINSHFIDINFGLLNLIKAFKNNKNKSLSINYENLISQPVFEMKNVCRFLKIQYSSDIVKLSTRNNMTGIMGDKLGSKIYKRINTKRADNWKEVFNNPYRIQWAKKYLNKIGEDNLCEIGYSYDVLIKNIKREKNIYSFSIINDIFTNLLQLFKYKMYCQR
jgi:Sulfotransferase family